MELIYIRPTTYIVMSGGLPSRTGHLMKIPFELVAIPVQRNRCGEPKIPHFALEGPKLGGIPQFLHPPHQAKQYHGKVHSSPVGI
jgi:hypothetical protein